jgi:cytosolic carboxypeptidase protein 2/3
MARGYSFKYESALNSNYSHMAAYFRKFHANFKQKNSRIFRGMNPTIPAGSELVFDSNFESGNLDAVVRVGEAEYDLYLRIDTNTRGHLQWFNFTVKNCAKTRVRFNIVNFKKAKTLYQRVSVVIYRECGLMSTANT